MPKKPDRFVKFSASKLRELREKAAQAEEMLQTARQVQADFNAYQDRMKRQKEEAARFGAEKLIKELLPALDAFDAALEKIDSEETAEGLRLVEREILRILEKFGVQVIQADGETFDPRVHQAVDAVPDKKPANTVVAVLKRGFTLHERVVRPAMVRVSRGPA